MNQQEIMQLRVVLNNLEPTSELYATMEKAIHILESRTGLVIQLFHGRKDPNQDMDDWGDDGPILGPFHSVQNTYGHLRFFDGLDECGEFGFHEDLVYYDGMFYGDFSIMAYDKSKHSPEPFDKGKAGWIPSEEHEGVNTFNPLKHQKQMNEEQEFEIVIEVRESYTRTIKAKNLEKAKIIGEQIASVTQTPPIPYLHMNEENGNKLIHQDEEIYLKEVKPKNKKGE